MRGVLLALLMLGVGCQDTFEAPPLPDLYKNPKDLGIHLPNDDLAIPAGDLGRRDASVDSN